MSKAGRSARTARGLGGLLRRFGRSQSGASALEFAFVVGPLLFLMGAILEVALVYTATFSLEKATAEAARLIRTGQAQGRALDASTFKTEVCKNLTPPLSCDGLKFDVRKFSNFGGVDFTDPLDGKGGMKQNFSFNPGAGGDVVVVRAFYEWHLIGKLPKDVGLSNMANGNRLLVATGAFRNEPFKAVAASPNS